MVAPYEDLKRREIEELWIAVELLQHLREAVGHRVLTINTGHLYLNPDNQRGHLYSYP
jgi:hypothetical protein